MAVRYEALKQRKLEELDALLREQADQVTHLAGLTPAQFAPSPFILHPDVSDQRGCSIPHDQHQILLPAIRCERCLMSSATAKST